LPVVATKDIWRKRVRAWRASGQRSEDYCTGLGVSAALLRHWAWRLRMTRKRGGVVERSAVAPVPLARVVRTIVPERPRRDEGAIRIEIGGARIEVRAGVDVATLAAVVAVLDGRLDLAAERS
jgi:hypothetical protein